jgi:hypothetical protein
VGVTLYKVLVNGQSCHGGSLTWSLPSDGKLNYEWHGVVSVWWRSSSAAVVFVKALSDFEKNSSTCQD